MTDFAVLRAPSQVLFGCGLAAAAGEVAAEHGRRVLLITDPVIAQTPGFATVVESLGELEVTVFADAAVDVPPSAVREALAQGEAARADVIVAVGAMGHAMALPAGLDALWGYEDPGPERARELIRLIHHDPAAATPEAVAARYRATLGQPWYPDLFPPPRQRWVDDLALTREELEEIAAPVLLVHGAQDRVVPLRDGFLPLLEVLRDVRGHVFGRCGHAAPLEHTDEFNPLLITFLETDR